MQVGRDKIKERGISVRLELKPMLRRFGNTPVEARLLVPDWKVGGAAWNLHHHACRGSFPEEHTSPKTVILRRRVPKLWARSFGVVRVGLPRRAFPGLPRK